MLYIEITKEKFDNLFNRWEKKEFEWTEETLNYLLISEGRYVAVDNTTHDFWVEEFATLDEAIEFFKGSEVY